MPGRNQKHGLGADAFPPTVPQLSGIMSACGKTTMCGGSSPAPMIAVILSVRATSAPMVRTEKSAAGEIFVGDVIGTPGERRHVFRVGRVGGERSFLEQVAQEKQAAGQGEGMRDGRGFTLRIGPDHDAPVIERLNQGVGLGDELVDIALVGLLSTPRTWPRSRLLGSSRPNRSNRCRRRRAAPDSVACLVPVIAAFAADPD